jgi:hypothetical protein
MHMLTNHHCLLLLKARISHLINILKDYKIFKEIRTIKNIIKIEFHLKPILRVYKMNYKILYNKALIKKDKTLTTFRKTIILLH